MGFAIILVCVLSHKTFADWDDYSLADFEGLFVLTWVVVSSVTQLFVQTERKLWRRPFWRGIRLLEMTSGRCHAQASRLVASHVASSMPYGSLGTRVALPMMHCKMSYVCDCSCCPSSFMYSHTYKSRGVEIGEWGGQACGAPRPIQFS